jgi:hypothetical protein
VRFLAFGGIRTNLLFEARTAADAAVQHDAMEAMQVPEAVETVATQPATVALALRYAKLLIAVDKVLACDVLGQHTGFAHAQCVRAAQDAGAADRVVRVCNVHHHQRQAAAQTGAIMPFRMPADQPQGSRRATASRDAARWPEC